MLSIDEAEEAPPTSPLSEEFGSGLDLSHLHLSPREDSIELEAAPSLQNVDSAGFQTLQSSPNDDPSINSHGTSRN